MKNCFSISVKFFFLLISCKAYCLDHNTNFITSSNIVLAKDSAIQPGDESLIAPGAKLQLVSNKLGFAEGPAANKKGVVFFSDQPNDKIWKYSTDGKLSVFMEKTGRSNGMYFDRKGNLISAADEKNQIWSITPSGKVTVLLSDFGGHRLNGPNDVWVDAKGGIYFTDPYYQRPYWDRKAPDIRGQNVYYLGKGKKEAVIVEDSMQQPNGIIGTRDGKYLYVSDIRARKTYRYTISGDGVLKDKQLFAQQGSDGMGIDNKGNIYLTGNGVTVYNPEGKKIEFISTPSRSTTNVCFSGKHKDILFITAVEAAYTLQMRVKGGE